MGGLDSKTGKSSAKFETSSREEEIGRIVQAQEVKDSSMLERSEVMDPETANWDDEYVSEFVRMYPAIMKQHQEDLDRVLKMDKSSPEYIAAKAKLYKSIVGNLIWRVNAEYMTQQQINSVLPMTYDNAERRRLGEQIQESQKRAKAYESFKGNMVLYAEAYDRFEHDRVDVERRLMSDIESGKVKISKDFPYVMFVNKEVDKQYSVIYKYNEAAKKLVLKTCNVVSTGDAVRWNASEPYDHSTPEKVFYIGAVKGVKHSSAGEAYGSNFADSDRQSYQVFRLYVRSVNDEAEIVYKRTSYLVHPTNEEPLLGETASHGCIRVPRRMNLQIVRMYDEWFKERGVNDFTEFPPVKGERRDIPKMPVVVSGI